MGSHVGVANCEVYLRSISATERDVEPKYVDIGHFAFVRQMAQVMKSRCNFFWSLLLCVRHLAHSNSARPDIR